MVAQDTGGAIRGPARTDFFWGWGAEAGERAGRMRDEGEVFVLLPRASPQEAGPRMPGRHAQPVLSLGARRA